jgi:hypothetical protein
MPLILIFRHIIRHAFADIAIFLSPYAIITPLLHISMSFSAIYYFDFIIDDAVSLRHAPGD